MAFLCLEGRSHNGFTPNRSLEIFESKVLQNVSHNHLKHQQLTNDLQIYCIFSDKMKEDFSNDRFGFTISVQNFRFCNLFAWCLVEAALHTKGL